ncbi:MAG: putative peptidoglycan biosynthesis protein MurJ [Firmicutes bacterium ADurb.Bin193]|nr:MAG: putative peptidoglycan biosynthesis protein MurJ [Firmicutes bacterium ADurb.Bin193]
MNKAVKTVSFIAAATMLAKVMGMLRDIILARSYGANFEIDAYMAASRIPLLFFDLTLGAAIISTFIPVFNRYLQKGEDRAASDFSNSFINLILIISGTLCVLGIVFSGALVNLIAPGYDTGVKLLTSHLLSIMLPAIVFTSLAYSFVGILQSFGEFKIPAVISLVSNTAVIAYLLFFNKYFGIYGLAVSMLAGWGLQVAVLIPSLIKKKYRYRFILNFKDKGLKDVFILALPVLISSWLQPVCVLINTIFASYFEEGSVAALELANRLYIIVVGVFVFAITNYTFPAMSKMSGRGDSDGFSDIADKSLRAMVAIIAPIMAGIMLLSNEVITIVYARGEFDERSVALTATALFFYSVGMVSFGANEILNKCFYAMKDGKTPMYSTVLGIICTVVFAFVLTKIFYLGIGGLALGASLSSVAVSGVLFYKMQRATGFLTGRKTGMFILKIIASTALGVVAAYMAKSFFAPYHIFIKTTVTAAVGALAYFAVLTALKTIPLPIPAKRSDKAK